MRDERGVTLVELMVAMLLLGVVSTAAATSFIALQRTLLSTEAATFDLGQARLTMNTTSKALRAAVRPPGGSTPFVAASPTDVTFHAALDPDGSGPRLVRFAFVDGELHEEVTMPTADGDSYTYDATDRTERVVARNLSPASGFQFYCGGVECPPSTPSSEWDAVGIVLAFEGATGQGHELRNRVRVVNRPYQVLPDDSVTP